MFLAEKTIEEIRSVRQKYDRIMSESGVNAFRELDRLEENALQSGRLDRKYKELIALGMSIGQSCYGCIEYHVTKAVEFGATRDEVIETTAVALALGGGTVQWPARFVFRVLEDLGVE
jgi:AhpD family alkylhydroperoxidase